ncbi:MAG: amidohydrolase family protein [Lachnospiraceae bacterium]|nr:amidohydrolase family protein [Lachnospiraceae bacterium]
MLEKTKIFHGDIVYSADRNTLAVHENSYIVVKDGFVEGISLVLPEEYLWADTVELGRGVLIPAFSDLHIHASQYAQRGIGMDRLLFDWLDSYTFPQEARYADPEYARAMYDAATLSMMKCGTFHASIFTTIHRAACDYLFERVRSLGMQAYIGKVNMDQNSPDFLCEDTSKSLKETEAFVSSHTGDPRVKPILTPRFSPTCSEPLMKGLGRIAAKYCTGLQTHLVESPAEAEAAKNWAPGYACDSDIYEKCGLLEHGPVIFAHVIFPEERDLDIIRKYNCLTVHCPEATTNVIAGIMKAERLLSEDNIPIALGSDIGGGSSPAVYHQAALAVQLSKQREFYFPEESGHLTFAQAFAMATLTGGSAFDHVGSLAPGYRFDALVLDGLEDPMSPLSPAEKLERFCYCGTDANIVKRYIDGKEIFL